MTIDESKKLIKGKIGELVRKKMPIMAGQMAVTHFQDNFRKGGFVDGGLHPWKPSKRIGRSKGADGERGTLLGSRQELFNSIHYKPGDGMVTVYTNCEYAAIHNEGGTINMQVHPTLTPKMRRFAWAKYYEAMGVKKGQKVAKGANVPPEADKWRKLALSKKQRLTINLHIVMPKRQFIGDSKELTDKIRKKFETEVRKIFNS
jgi:phage gpG-like protein